MARSSRTRARFAPLLSSAALSLAFIGQLCGLVHMAVVRHETCPEHGELVEVGSPVVVKVLDVDVDELSARDDDADSHDHCPLATMPAQHEHLAVIAVDEVARAISRELAAVTVSERVVDVLAVAPKTSPPVVV